MAPMKGGILVSMVERYVAETLMPLILSVEQAYKEAKRRPKILGRISLPRQALYWPPIPALFRQKRNRSPWRQAKIYFKRDEPKPYRRT